MALVFYQLVDNFLLFFFYWKCTLFVSDCIVSIALVLNKLLKKQRAKKKAAAKNTNKAF